MINRTPRTAGLQQALAPLRQRWSALAPREQRLLRGAAWLVGLALLWWVALAPALRTLTAARAEHGRLDAQLQQMASLQAQARALQTQARANPGDSMKALQDSVQGLGPNAQLLASGAGDSAQLSVRGVSADALAQWLAQARGNARTLPREAHLTRAAATPAAPGGPAGRPAPKDKAAADSAGARWDGTLSLGLPPAR